ncbi:MAG: glutamyl-tRNA reductase [Alphaproteobacteria bacterium]|jgi:glutamyl-tRNA reductase|nr:glutamyl-tRNA reductase [Alphaproteobacteria bacterium]
MHIVCVGISHQTAGVALRERLALGDEGVADMLGDLRSRYPQAELAALSTCNRTEVYVARPLHGHPRIEQLVAYLAHRHGVEPQTLGEALYHYDNERAIRHLFRVAGGLESMILGEDQIIGQVRAAYDAAQRAETAGRAIHRMFQLALAVGKRIRSRTDLNHAHRSVASAAVQFARHLFESIDDKTVLAIGAGQTVELTVQQFAGMHPRRLRVCNRSPERARAIAHRFGGEVVSFDRLDKQLTDADVVITATGAAEPFLTARRFKAILRRRRLRPVFVIDLAVPRDAEAAVGDLPNVYLFDMDALQRAVAQTAPAGPGALTEAEQIVEQTVGECYALVQQGDLSDLVRRLRRQVHRLGEAQNQRTVNRLCAAEADDYERLVAEHTERLINRILHTPLAQLSGDSRQAALYATALRRLFGLGEEDLTPPESTRPEDQQRNASRDA